VALTFNTYAHSQTTRSLDNVIHRGAQSRLYYSTRQPNRSAQTLGRTALVRWDDDANIQSAGGTYGERVARSGTRAGNEAEDRLSTGSAVVGFEARGAPL